MGEGNIEQTKAWHRASAGCSLARSPGWGDRKRPGPQLTASLRSRRFARVGVWPVRDVYVHSHGEAVQGSATDAGCAGSSGCCFLLGCSRAACTECGPPARTEHARVDVELVDLRRFGARVSSRPAGSRSERSVRSPVGPGGTRTYGDVVSRNRETHETDTSRFRGVRGGPLSTSTRARTTVCAGGCARPCPARMRRASGARGGFAVAIAFVTRIRLAAAAGAAPPDDARGRARHRDRLRYGHGVWPGAR